MNFVEEKQSLRATLLPVSRENGITSTRRFDKNEVFAEIKKQLLLAGPLVSVNLLINCLQVISVMFVGHLGELALSGASMATSFASVTGFSLLIGMGSALDTFCGQSYGAKQYHMLGVHKQRAMIVLLLTSVPLALIWTYAGNILLIFGQDPEIAMEAGSYARFMTPSIFAFGLLQCHIRFLQAQNIVLPMMVSTGITTLLHILVCWTLVFKSGLGNKGAALANAISLWTNVLFLAIYVRISPSCKETWTGFSKEAFHGILSFLRLGIPSAVMLCLEIWSFEMMVLLSGLLPNPKLETSVLSICLNTCSLVYMIPLGLSGAIRWETLNDPAVADLLLGLLIILSSLLISYSSSSFLSVRVSNELGAGRPRAACLAICTAVGIVLCEGLTMGAAIILGRKTWGHFYSSEEVVVGYVAEILPLIALSHFFDGIQSVLSGTCRGCGWQKVGAFVNLAAYYLLGIPVSVVLAFVLHLGGKGLWTGIIVALFAQGFFLAILTICTNWEKEAKKATDRVESTMVSAELLK